MLCSGDHGAAGAPPSFPPPPPPPPPSLARYQAPRLLFLLDTWNELQGVESAEAAGPEGLQRSASMRGARPRLASSASSREVGAGKMASTTGKRFTQDMSALMLQLQA